MYFILEKILNNKATEASDIQNSAHPKALVGLTSKSNENSIEKSGWRVAKERRVCKVICRWR